VRRENKVLVCCSLVSLISIRCENQKGEWNAAEEIWISPVHETPITPFITATDTCLTACAISLVTGGLFAEPNSGQVVYGTPFVTIPGMNCLVLSRSELLSSSACSVKVTSYA
jgi:hypothetical protein